MPRRVGSGVRPGQALGHHGERGTADRLAPRVLAVVQRGESAQVETTTNDRLGSQLVLSSMSMVPIGFRDLVASAAAAGFDAVSVVGPVHRRARYKEGLSDQDMRAILDDHGMAVSEVEAAGNWLTGPEDKPPRWLERYSDDEFLDIAEALHARVLVAVHFGAPVIAEQAAEAFADLCDRAADRGLGVSLEFPAFATVRDISTAWDIVRLADRPNGGVLLDVWHHYRGLGDDAAIQAIPGDRITAIQLSDATAQPVGTLEEDVLRRQMPGEGSFNVPRLLGTLEEMGVRAPVGIEVWDEELLAQGPLIAAQRLADALRAVLTDARKGK
jgi:sugar phosphate isomerase/epimerase